MHDKIDKLEDLIINIRSANTTEYNNEGATIHDKDSFQCIINNDFPLKDEDSLQKFEDKLIFDPNFTTQMVKMYSNKKNKNKCFQQFYYSLKLFKLRQINT